jgi:hypothetical protein
MSLFIDRNIIKISELFLYFLKKDYYFLSKILLKFSRHYDPEKNAHAIGISSRHGYIDIITKLLKDDRIRPTILLNWGVEEASQNGHIEIVKLLLKDERISPSDSQNLSVFFAARSNHIDIVKLLLKDLRVNPSDSSNRAINATKSFDIAKLLWKHKSVKQEFKYIKKELLVQLKENDLKNKIGQF